MPYIGRYTSYPTFPDFGSDPTQFNNVMAIIYQKLNFLPGTTINFQLKTADRLIRVYDQALFFLESEVDYTVLEDVTCTDGVTVLTPQAADRNSPFVSSVFASTDPTGISGGIIFEGMEQFALSTDIVGMANRVPLNVQYVTLKLNANYIFRFANMGTEPIVNLRFVILIAE